MYLGLNPLGTGTVTLEEGGTHFVGGDLAVRDGTGTYNMLGGTLTVGGFFQVARNGHGTFIAVGWNLGNRTNAAAGMFIGTSDRGGSQRIVSKSAADRSTVAGTNEGVIVGNGATPSAGGTMASSGS